MDEKGNPNARSEYRAKNNTMQYLNNTKLITSGTLTSITVLYIIAKHKSATS